MRKSLTLLAAAIAAAAALAMLLHRSAPPPGSSPSHAHPAADARGDAGGAIVSVAPTRPEVPPAGDAGGQRRGVATGRVLDREGRPVHGAFVECDDFPFGATATTDADGRYRLEGLRLQVDLRIHAFVPGAPPDRDRTWLRPDEPEHRLDFVVDAPPDGGFLFELRFPSAPSGQFEIALEVRGHTHRCILPPRDADLRVAEIPAAEEARFTALAPGFRALERLLRSPRAGAPPERLRIDFVPGPAPRILHVVDEEGEPASDVRLWFSPPMYDPLAQIFPEPEDGAFPVPADWIGRRVLATGRGSLCSDWLLLSPDATDPVLRLGAGGTVAGRVVDRATGRPVSGAQVLLRYAIGLDEDYERTTSDAAGEYRFTGVPPGAFVLPLVEPSWRAVPAGEPRDVDSASRIHLLESGRAAILGESGEGFRRDLAVEFRPGGNVVVLAPRPAGAAGRPVEWSHIWTDPAGVVAADGGDVDAEAFELRRFLSLGVHEIHLKCGDWIGSTGAIEVRGDGDLGEHRIRLRPAPRVAVQLVGDRNRPLREAGVEIDFGPLPAAVTDASGRAVLSGPLPHLANLVSRFEFSCRTGMLRLEDSEFLRRLLAAGDELVLDLTVLPEAESVDLIVLDPEGRTPHPARRVRIRLLDEHGLPAGNQPVTSFDAHPWHWTTGDDGGFTALLGNATSELSIHLEQREERIALPEGAAEVVHRFHRRSRLWIRVVAPPEIDVEQYVEARALVTIDGKPQEEVERLHRTEPLAFEWVLELPRVPRTIRVRSPDGRWTAVAEVGPSADAVSLTLKRD